MTLILSVVKKKFIVVSADGAEFRHNPGEQKFMEVTNRQKLFPLLDRNVVLAVHGQNRLTPNGEKIDSQRLINEIIEELSLELAPIPTVKGITLKLFELLTPTVNYTFKLLQSLKIHNSALGICVFGFDIDGGRSRGFEGFWPRLTDDSTSQVIKLVQDKDDVRIIHSGTGARYAQLIINNPQLRYHPNHLKRASVSKVQNYIRKLFCNASSKQPKDAQEFGGDYSEVTITQKQLEWTKSSA